MMGPLLLKSIISFAEERSAALASGGTPPNLGVDSAMSLGLSFLTIITSMCTNHVRGLYICACPIVTENQSEVIVKS